MYPAQLANFSINHAIGGTKNSRSQYASYSEYTRRIGYISYSECWWYWSAGGVNTASTGSMSITEGPNTASTGVMSSTEPRVRQHPQYRTPKYLESWQPQYNTPKYCEYSVCNPAVLAVLQVLHLPP